MCGQWLDDSAQSVYRRRIINFAVGAVYMNEMQMENAFLC